MGMNIGSSIGNVVSQGQQLVQQAGQVASQAQALVQGARNAAGSLLAGGGGRGGGGGPTSGNLVHAFLEKASGGGRFEFLLNPTELEFIKENKWASSTRRGQNVSQSEFLGGQPIKFNLTFVLDTSEESGQGRNVRNKVISLGEFWSVDANLRDPRNNLSSPPPLRFHWGAIDSNQVYVLTKMSYKYTRFDPDGTPIRAEVQLSLQQWADSENRPRQNPTSGALIEQRYYQVRPGQTLDLIAYEVYGDSTHWRLIAEANELDDPLDLRPGQMLRINDDY
jgi:hypothetical protein